MEMLRAFLVVNGCGSFAFNTGQVISYLLFLSTITNAACIGDLFHRSISRKSLAYELLHSSVME
jgi:hypothetical protein